MQLLKTTLFLIYCATAIWTLLRIAAEVPDQTARHSVIVLLWLIVMVLVCF